GIEAVHTVLDRVPRGQHQDRRAVAALPELPAHREPVSLGHQDVEDHGVELGAGRGAQRLLAVGGEVNLVALELQSPLQCPAELGLVVYDKYPHVTMLARSPKRTLRMPPSPGMPGRE